MDAGGSPPNGAARATGPSPGGAGPVSVVQNGPAAQPVAAGNQVPPVAPMPSDQSNTMSHVVLGLVLIGAAFYVLTRWG